MKSINYLVSAILICLMYTGKAQVITTLQHNGATTVYYNQNGLVDAYAAAANGDTIYLSGGHFNPVNINKKLRIFGAGHFPDSTSATGITYIDGGFEIQDLADSSHLEGVFISGSLTFQNDVPTSYVHLRRNYINGSINFSGSRTTPCTFTLIEGNVVNGSVDLSNTLQSDVSNNFIQNSVYYSLNSSIRNNVFLGGAYYGWPHYAHYNIYDCDNTLIENNVFSYANLFIYCDNTLFRNNVFVGSPSMPNSTPTMVGNYNNVAPASLFVNYTTSSFTYTDNYHLQSPTVYLGSDGTQVGVYGNAYPFKASAVPVNPHIPSAIIPANTDVNGNLNINIKATAQQQ